MFIKNVFSLGKEQCVKSYVQILKESYIILEKKLKEKNTFSGSKDNWFKFVEIYRY